MIETSLARRAYRIAFFFIPSVFFLRCNTAVYIWYNHVDSRFYTLVVLYEVVAPYDICIIINARARKRDIYDRVRNNIAMVYDLLLLIIKIRTYTNTLYTLVQHR